MTKKLLILGVFGLVGIISSGCGTSTTSEEESEVKIVKVWVHKSSEEPEGQVYNQIRNNFNNLGLKTSTGKTVRMSMEFYGSTLETKINASVLTGGLPDIIAIDSSDIAAKANAGIIVPIGNHLDQTLLDSYIDSVIEQSTIDDQLFALSGMEAPGGLYYNRRLLEAVGYTSDQFGTVSNPWSWDDVLDAMKSLKAAGRPYQIKLNLGFGDDGYMYLYSPLVYSAGATFGTDDHVEEALTADNAVAGIAQLEKFFSRTGLATGESWVYSGASETAFAEEAIPFQIYGPWDARTIEKGTSAVKGNYDIMPYPVYESSTGVKSEIVATPCGSFGFAATRDARDIEAAALAISYLTGPDSSTMMFNAIGTFPTHRALLSELEAFQSGVMKSLADYLLVNVHTRPKMIKYPQLKVAYGEVLSYIKNMNQVTNYDLLAKIRTEMRAVDNAVG